MKMAVRTGALKYCLTVILDLNLPRPVWITPLNWARAASRFDILSKPSRFWLYNGHATPPEDRV
jgi:hypothetical protein